MTNILAILSKDLRSYFFSVTAYVLITVFLLISGFFFSAAVSYFSFYSFQLSSQPSLASQGLNLTDAVISGLFFNLSVIFLLMMPVLTMRSIAEEQKEGTFELLLTYPVSESEVVVGKFLAALFVFLVMLTPAVIPLLILKWVGGVFEWGVVSSGFLGVALSGIAFLAFGLFASSLTENQIVSALIAFGFLLLLWVISWASDFLPTDLALWVNELSVTRHLEDFFKGIVELRHIFFYTLFTFFFLLLTIWRLETRRWVR